MITIILPLWLYYGMLCERENVMGLVSGNTLCLFTKDGLPQERFDKLHWNVAWAIWYKGKFSNKLKIFLTTILNAGQTTKLLRHAIPRKIIFPDGFYLKAAYSDSEEFHVVTILVQIIWHETAEIWILKSVKRRRGFTYCVLIASASKFQPNLLSNLTKKVLTFVWPCRPCLSWL